MNNGEIQQDLQRFKAQMMLHRPFFGDILLRLPIVQDDSIPTACTDGRTIRWSGRFFSTLNSAQRHYVLMHEVLHTLLMHPLRLEGHDPDIWNIAADMMVNSMCDAMARDIANLSDEPMMQRPQDGIFATFPRDLTAEDLYGMIRADMEKKGNQYSIRKDFRPGLRSPSLRIDVTPDRDLLPGGAGGAPLTEEERKLLEEQIGQLIRQAASVGRSAFGSYFIPQQLVLLTRPKPIPWRQVLKEHLTEVTSDDASYATPERKYLHMDLILPGYCLTEDGDLESLWAFVDSSGSISAETLNQFLTQLYRIVKEFHCELNICYWDTQVTDVYTKIRTEKQVLECQPRHSGGTDINCVYRWMAENHVRPDVLLILTDGYFGQVTGENARLLRPRDTVLVISNDSVNPHYKEIGKVCRLI